jgi:hypothetical protein
MEKVLLIQKMMTNVDHVLMDKVFFQVDYVEIVPQDKELILTPKFVQTPDSITNICTES